MSKVFVYVGMSLDGFIAGPNRGPSNPLGDRGSKIHAWMFGLRSFRQALGLGAGGERGPDDDLVASTNARTGANVMGKRMFDEGEASWPENAPFHTPVLVLTKETRAPWHRPGGTTFHFVQGSIESAVSRARELAGAKDVRISGGAHVIRAALAAGLVDELQIALAPIVLGEGLRLFDGSELTKLKLEQQESTRSSAVTHLKYALR
jgi:dihydrofolate reductase